MENIQNFNSILQSFNIKATCTHVSTCDNYIFYDIKLNNKTKIKDLQKYADEIALSLKSHSKPNFRPIYDTGLVRVEFAIPNNNSLQLFDYFTNDDVPEGDLVCLLGKNINGDRVWMDLAKNPHMIVAGTTGSGKSTLIHNIIANVLNYNSCIMYLFDPKNIEFYKYKEMPRFIRVISKYDECDFYLDSLLYTMEQRYITLRDNPNIKFPYILVIIDEFADLIMNDKDNVFYYKLCKLAQKCRAAKMSIILATQRPSVNFINGTIKANFPARIACKVASHIDSKIILDTSGAETLIGRGDALLKDNSRYLERFQVAYTEPFEIVKYFS